MRHTASLDQDRPDASEHSGALICIPAGGNYGSTVAPDVQTRLARFRVFVRLALETAMRDRGWESLRVAVREVAAEANLAESTIWLWIYGKGLSEPQAGKVVAFCDALDLSPVEAFRILWPGKHEKPAEPEPADIPSDMRTLIRMLRSDAVPDEVKLTVRATVAWLARQNRVEGDNGGEGRNRDVS
jgi:hypothetical protein